MVGGVLPFMMMVAMEWVLENALSPMLEIDAGKVISSPRAVQPLKAL